jgi:calcineurin-like phosphoesterase family protein
MIYFISDTHFCHKGSLKWPDGHARQFSSVEEMNQTIIDNWNSIVKDEDIVYHLGDFCYKGKSSTIKEIMQQLKGHIILIKGNHDGQTLKINQQVHRFESIHERLELEYKFKDKTYHFVLDHYPLDEWNLKKRGSIHLHGHIHDRVLPFIPNRFNMSVEVNNYTPVSMEDILEIQYYLTS